MRKGHLGSEGGEKKGIFSKEKKFAPLNFLTFLMLYIYLPFAHGA